MKKIYSKTLHDRLDKEAGLWDTVKGVGSTLKGVYDKGKDIYEKGKDVAQRARVGWELGKMDIGEQPWKQRLNSMMYEGAYPKNPQGQYIYKKDIIDENGQTQRVPHNPFFVKGFKDKMTRQRSSNFGRYGMPRGKKINPMRENEPGIKDVINQALEALNRDNDHRLLNNLEMQGIIINEGSQIQPGATQQAGQAPVPTPVQPVMPQTNPQVQQ